MPEPISTERLAEILWAARKRTLGYDDTAVPLAAMPADTRTQYANLAIEVAELLDAEGRDHPTDLRWLGTPQVADRLGVGLHRVGQLIRSGELAAVRAGARRWRVREDHLDDYQRDRNRGGR